MTQIDLAKRLDLASGTVAGWESGRNGIRIDHLAVLARVLNVSISALVGEAKAS